MSMIRIENLTFHYPSSFDPVFENANFQIDTEWNLGFVGRNGRGKTTLLKILLGEYEYSGRIISSVLFDYFPFSVSDKTQITDEILAEICLNAPKWELMRELSYLKVEEDVLWRPFETLSNGEQTKVLLAALFLKEGNFLLIFVGRNGRGKTTLLKILLGEYEYSGRIISSVLFDYFPFPVSDKTQITDEILAEICPNVPKWELMRELSYLKVEEDVLWRPFETLSNGEQTKVLLAALFLKEGNFLLIDEPTNHLDVCARRQVANYLKKKKGFLLVSHDRYLLDECTDHILSLNRVDIEVQSGNFSSWLENFERQQQFERNQNERLRKDIRRLKESAKQSEG